MSTEAGVAPSKRGITFHHWGAFWITAEELGSLP